ncbi:MAG: hypothetical protein GX579_05010 [Chloroflexi bacterium]|jgi:hypothetical protein|nr:hypothetical protein [Chloroflexota bacterium]
MRYGKLWGETDTNVFAVLIRAMVDEAKLVPVQRVYPNGYGFPVLATYLVSISGLSVTGMQLAGGALLAVWVVLPVWLAYRELVGSARGATLATVLILIQPEFLFPILRGTHEKFTRGLMFLCLFLLVRSILARQTWRRFAALLLGFYLASYALITFNNLLATSFIVALGLALVLGLIMRYLIAPRSDSSDTMRRLLYAVSISLLLAFLFTFYAYPPARHGLRIVESVWDRMAMLFLDVEEVAANPYHTLTTAWVSFPVYLIVSIANWLLLIASFVLWIVQTHTWWRKRTWPEEPRTILLWSLYGAFGFLGAVSILVDVSGAIALNLQHRIFPSFAMIAAPFVTAWSLRQQTFRTTTRPLAYGLLVVVISFLSVVAVAKATNEPLVSNRWVFSTPAEFTGLDWARQNNPNGSTWAAFDSRLRASTGIQYGWETQGAKFDSHDPAPSTRTHLISDVMRARSERLNLRLPIEGDSLRVYDNGAAELYHLRPRTPYQK